jgi:hypothetical protein
MCFKNVTRLGRKRYDLRLTRFVYLSQNAAFAREFARKSGLRGMGIARAVPQLTPALQISIQSVLRFAGIGKGRKDASKQRGKAK